MARSSGAKQGRNRSSQHIHRRRAIFFAAKFLAQLADPILIDMRHVWMQQRRWLMGICQHLSQFGFTRFQLLGLVLQLERRIPEYRSAVHKSGAVKIADHQHSQHLLGIDRRANRVAVEVCQFITDHIEIQQPVDLAQQVITGNVILNLETIKQVLLRFQPSHHHPILPPSKAFESA